MDDMDDMDEMDALCFSILHSALYTSHFQSVSLTHFPGMCMVVALFFRASRMFCRNTA